MRVNLVIKIYYWLPKYLSNFVFGNQEIPAFNGNSRKEQDPERIKFERERAAEQKLVIQNTKRPYTTIRKRS